MRTAIILVGGALVLSACGEADQPKSPEEVLAAADNLVKPRPGLYRSSAEIIDFEIPGIPPEQAAQMRRLRMLAAVIPHGRSKELAACVKDCTFA